jgi:GT2 family glycosyltransferase
MNPKISTIILNWNNFKDTKECIESLKQSGIPFFKIIVIDNGSSDNSADLLEKEYKNISEIIFIRNGKNLGFASGVNIGIKLALEINSDYVFLINNDALIKSDTIIELLSVFNFDNVGISGPRIFFYNEPQKIWQGGGYFSYLKAGVKVPEKNKFENTEKLEKKEVSFLTGCAMLIKKDVFEKVGLFDEKFFFYTEDLDLCLRALRGGFKIMYVPSSKVYHKIEGISKSRTSPFVFYNLSRSFIIFIWKNFSFFYFLYGIFLHFFIYTLYRFLQLAIGSRDIKSIFAWFKGTMDGIKSIVS